MPGSNPRNSPRSAISPYRRHTCARTSRLAPMGRGILGCGSRHARMVVSGVGGARVAKWWDLSMSRVIAVVACGFTVAACSASMPNLSFFNSSPPTETVRFESEPPGAEVKMSSGQACRTPCEISVQVAPELSAGFTLAGYQTQTVALKSEGSSGFGASARLSPNPVYAELQPVPAAPIKKKHKRKPVVASSKPAAMAPVASAAPAPGSVPPAMPANPPEAAASATNYPWPSR
jgi:hypothetical protein